jgi:hypothetical protein
MVIHLLPQTLVVFLGSKTLVSDEFAIHNVPHRGRLQSNKGRLRNEILRRQQARAATLKPALAGNIPKSHSNLRPVEIAYF